MLDYIVRRLLVMIPTLLIISILVFIIIQLPPGDYLTTLIQEYQDRGEQIGEEVLAFYRENYGFGEPMWKQYLLWMKGILLEGNMGFL